MADDIVGKVRSIFDDVVGAKQSELQAITSTDPGISFTACRSRGPWKKKREIDWRD